MTQHSQQERKVERGRKENGPFVEFRPARDGLVLSWRKLWRDEVHCLRGFVERLRLWARRLLLARLPRGLLQRQHRQRAWRLIALCR